MAVFIKAKKALIKKSAFIKPPSNLLKLLVTSSGLAYITITQEIIAQVLTFQAETKTPS